MIKPFQFRQFHLYDDRCAMKIGTDGVLLGAWVSVRAAKNMLDIGSGCGLIALMLAQRTDPSTHIKAVEIRTEDAEQATENIAASPWPDRIHVHALPIQDFITEHAFDLIVSNPPFFNHSLLPPSTKRKTARHTDTLSYTDLLNAAARLIAPGGIFALVLPVKEGLSFISLAQFTGFYLQRQCAVYTKAEKPQERWLLEFSRNPGQVVIETLILSEDSNERSKAYKDLTKEFYL